MKRASAEPEALPGVVRTTISLTVDSLRDAKTLANDRNTTIQDVIRRAIFLEKFLADEIKAGGKVQVIDADNNVKELVLR